MFWLLFRLPRIYSCCPSGKYLEQVGVQSVNLLRQQSNCCSFAWSNKASFESDIPSVNLLEISDKQTKRNQSPSHSMLYEFQGFLGGHKIECDHQSKIGVQLQGRKRIERTCIITTETNMESHLWVNFKLCSQLFWISEIMISFWTLQWMFLSLSYWNCPENSF